MFVYLFLRSCQSCNLSSKHRRRILACPFLSRLQHSHIFASRIIFFLLFSNVPFSLLFPILLSASGCPCGMGEDVLYFDRSSGKRKVKPYQSLTENSKANTQWFDPSTGRLCAMQANPSMVPVSMNHKQGFFGGAHSSPLTETRGQSCSSKEFEDKVKSKRRHGEGPNYSPTKIGRSVTGLKYCGRWVTLKLCVVLSFISSDLNHTAMRLFICCAAMLILFYIYFHHSFHPRTVLPCFGILDKCENRLSGSC